MTQTPPTIFAARRRLAQRRRMRALQAHGEAPRFVIDHMVEDVLDRLDFLRHTPARALIIGDHTGTLATTLAQRGCTVTRADPAPGAGEIAIDEETPLALGPFDLIASLGTLDTVNDVPGALIHLRRALAADGLALISFPGAGSLPLLRQIMLAADGDHPAPRLHPQIDVRTGGQLLQRAGFADPVIDSQPLRASYRSLDRLIADLRAQGLSACLARGGPPLTRAALVRAQAAFATACSDGRAVETIEILTLSGWARALRAPKF